MRNQSDFVLDPALSWWHRRGHDLTQDPTRDPTQSPTQDLAQDGGKGPGGKDPGGKDPGGKDPGGKDPGGKKKQKGMGKGSSVAGPSAADRAEAADIAR